MDRQNLIRDMKRYCKGASFITKAQFKDYVGFSRATADRKLRGLEKVDGKYYFIPDVVKKMLGQ